MSVPWPPPEFPVPSPPGRTPPGAPQPVAVPIVDVGAGLARDSLTEQRRILVSGILDREAVTSLAAQLMAFDGLSSRDVEILLNSSGGPVSDFLPVLDVFDLMRAKVNVTVIGSVSGTAVGLVATGTGERRAAPHARFSLRLDATQAIHGTAEDITRHAGELAHQRARYLAALAAATGQDEGVLAEQLDRGRTRTAEEARAMGIVDGIAGQP
ncbi:MAG: ATP-dependent Clp protease proteolytic subunit [Actinomycetota bacterium]